MKDFSRSAAWLVGFGGPAKPEELRPFLESVLEGVRIPESRLKEVMRHYELFDGVSPYNAAVERQRKDLEAWFRQKGVRVPVFASFRHSQPSFEEALILLDESGVQNVAAFVLSPLRCQASFEKYLQKIESALRKAEVSDISIRYAAPFHDHPLFVEAQAENILNLLEEAGLKKERMRLFFCAHSVPVEMSQKSGYEAQFRKSSELIAGRVGAEHWQIAYQSRSGNPADPWLGPDIKERLGENGDGRTAVLVPSGFVCDNIEILYDLDTEARQKALSLGLDYRRAATVADHPKFIELIGIQVMGVLAGAGEEGL